MQSESLVENGEPRGFKLRFTFAENPFFTNTVSGQQVAGPLMVLVPVDRF